MLSPKKTKFRKQHRGRLKGKASRGNKISFGDYAIQALEPTWLTSRQIEATRRTITRYTKRGGKLWITVFPDKPVTARAAESRMGSGKGSVVNTRDYVVLLHFLQKLFCSNVLPGNSYLPHIGQVIGKICMICMVCMICMICMIYSHSS